MSTLDVGHGTHLQAFRCTFRRGAQAPCEAIPWFQLPEHCFSPSHLRRLPPSLRFCLRPGNQRWAQIICVPSLKTPKHPKSRGSGEHWAPKVGLLAPVHRLNWKVSLCFVNAKKRTRVARRHPHWPRFRHFKVPRFCGTCGLGSEYPPVVLVRYQWFLGSSRTEEFPEPGANPAAPKAYDTLPLGPAWHLAGQKVRTWDDHGENPLRRWYVQLVGKVTHGHLEARRLINLHLSRVGGGRSPL